LLSKSLILSVCLSLILLSCNEESLHIVTVKEFAQFVEDTNYETDAEKYEWSIVQQDIFTHQILWGIDWRCPDGFQEARDDEAVRQVSYNDAAAYCRWSRKEIPDYDNYWAIVTNDKRPINENSPGILPLDQVNIVGNLWELTQPDEYDRIRLAGGSYLCSPNSCNGTSPERDMHIDRITGNSHIGFAVID